MVEPVSLVGNSSGGSGYVWPYPQLTSRIPARLKYSCLHGHVACEVIFAFGNIFLFRGLGWECFYSGIVTPSPKAITNLLGNQ